MKTLQNGKTHIEGEKNTRACKCASCGGRIPRLEGYKVIEHGSYSFLHVDCKKDYFVINVDHDKTYNHGLTFEVKIVTQKREKFLSLLNYGFTVIQKGFFTLISVKTTSRNSLKELRSIDGFSYKAVVKITNSEGYYITFTKNYKRYQQLSVDIVKASYKAFNIKLDNTLV